MNEKNQKLFNALLDYLGIQENYVLKGGLFIGTTINAIVGKVFEYSKKELCQR